MSILVCYPIKSLVQVFLPEGCEALTVENYEELSMKISGSTPCAIVIFTETMDVPPWDWLTWIYNQTSQDVVKIIVPLHRDEELIHRIIETSCMSNTFVLPAKLSNDEIRFQLTCLLGLGKDREPMHETKMGEGKIYTLVSYGSAGVSTFCINYPVVLASLATDSKVAVIDFNVEKPDITNFFQLANNHLALYRPYLLNTGKAESQDWKSIFKRSAHLPNLYLATAATRWKGYEISSLLSALRKQFDYIFIDWGFCFREQEVLHRLLLMSDSSMFFVRPDPFNLESSRKWLSKWRNTTSPIQLVVSHYHKDEMSIERIRSFMGTPVLGVVPRLSYSRVLHSLQSKSILVEELFPPKTYLNSLRSFALEEVHRRKREVLIT
ncbi:hypothetical protein [Brevibacillus sp. SYSU BS000544]|uniref:hypothetical protein n=1 Tax=Brevibacillus sp. SYSU BS000544 TaxID=3416443 RepID=UPI003CE4715E